MHMQNANLLTNPVPIGKGWMLTEENNQVVCSKFYPDYSSEAEMLYQFENQNFIPHQFNVAPNINKSLYTKKKHPLGRGWIESSYTPNKGIHIDACFTQDTQTQSNLLYWVDSGSTLNNKMLKEGYFTNSTSNLGG